MGKTKRTEKSRVLFKMPIRHLGGVISDRKLGLQAHSSGEKSRQEKLS